MVVTQPLRVKFCYININVVGSCNGWSTNSPQACGPKAPHIYARVCVKLNIV